MPAYGALNGSFTANPNLNKPEDDGFMQIGDIKGADFMGELESSGTTPAGGISANADTLLNPDDFNINDELIENPVINDAVRDGIDIERMTGIGFDENLHTSDYWSTAAAIDLISQGATNGMVGFSLD